MRERRSAPSRTRTSRLLVCTITAHVSSLLSSSAPSWHTRRPSFHRLRHHGTLCLVWSSASSWHKCRLLSSSAPSRRTALLLLLLKLLPIVSAPSRHITGSAPSRHTDSALRSIVHLFRVLTRCSYSIFSHQLFLRHHGTFRRLVRSSAPSRRVRRRLRRHGTLAPSPSPRACLQDPERTRGSGLRGRRARRLHGQKLESLGL